MRHVLIGGLLLTVIGSLPESAPAQDKVEVKVVKYDDLGRLVRQHQGKVVVVDLWATW